MSGPRVLTIQTCAQCFYNVDHPEYMDYCLKYRRKIPSLEIPGWCRLPKPKKGAKK